MDVVLERILSLIPRKPNGKFVHGAKTEFAEKIGVNHPQIVSDWIAKRSSSYKNYVYVIAAKYNVSVEWLRGETDDPTPQTGDGQKNTAHQTVSGHSAYDASVLSWFYSLPPEKRQAILSLGDAPKELLEGLGREQY